MTTPPHYCPIWSKIESEGSMMVVKITAKRDRLELPEGPDGFLLRPQRIDFASLAPLRDTIRRHRGPFDLEEFRNQRHDPALRD